MVKQPVPDIPDLTVYPREYFDLLHDTKRKLTGSLRRRRREKTLPEPSYAEVEDIVYSILTPDLVSEFVRYERAASPHYDAELVGKQLLEVMVGSVAAGLGNAGVEPYASDAHFMQRRIVKYSNHIGVLCPVDFERHLLINPMISGDALEDRGVIKTFDIVLENTERVAQPGLGDDEEFSAFERKQSYSIERLRNDWQRLFPLDSRLDDREVHYMTSHMGHTHSAQGLDELVSTRYDLDIPGALISARVKSSMGWVAKLLPWSLGKRESIFDRLASRAVMDVGHMPCVLAELIRSSGLTLPELRGRLILHYGDENDAHERFLGNIPKDHADYRLLHDAFKMLEYEDIPAPWSAGKNKPLHMEFVYPLRIADYSSGKSVEGVNAIQLYDPQNWMVAETSPEAGHSRRSMRQKKDLIARQSPPEVIAGFGALSGMKRVYERSDKVDELGRPKYVRNVEEGFWPSASDAIDPRRPSMIDDFQLQTAATQYNVALYVREKNITNVPPGKRA